MDNSCAHFGGRATRPEIHGHSQWCPRHHGGPRTARNARKYQWGAAEDLAEGELLHLRPLAEFHQRSKTAMGDEGWLRPSTCICAQSCKAMGGYGLTQATPDAPIVPGRPRAVRKAHGH